MNKVANNFKTYDARWGVQFRAAGARGWKCERIVFDGCETDDEALERYERWNQKERKRGAEATVENRLIRRTADEYEVLATKGL